MIPATVVAHAIVAACRETGEDPILCASGENGGLPGVPNKTCRARHYALQALRDVFPDEDAVRLARCVGAPCEPETFVRVSTFQVARPLPGTSRRKALWWIEEQFARVVASVRAVAPGARPKSSKPPSAATQVKRAPDAKHGQPRTGLDRFATKFAPNDNQAGGDDQLGRRQRERRECGDLLAEAAANTARLQAKLPRESDSGE